MNNPAFIVLKQPCDWEATYNEEEATARVKELRKEGFDEAFALVIDLDTDKPTCIDSIPTVIYHMEGGKSVPEEMWNDGN